MVWEWLETDQECPECGSSNTRENRKTGAIECEDCGMEYVQR